MKRATMPAPSRIAASQAPILALGIGCSTGGPEALSEILSAVRAGLHVPVFITQHMPPAFTALLAEHLSKIAGHECVEAKDGETAQPGHVYIAPGDRHMLVKGTRREPVIRISDGPQENFCRPSVDPMFKSLAKLYGSSLLAVVLTGMGQDGLLGTRAVVAQGGTVIVQDRGTSVVWGMPGAVAGEGLASRVLPLNRIGREIAALIGGHGE